MIRIIMTVFLSLIKTVHLLSLRHDHFLFLTSSRKVLSSNQASPHNPTVT
jgi:hypothetical protein